MKTCLETKAKSIKVHFHVGRGGRFHNSGHKTFQGVINSLSDLFGERTFVLNQDEDGKPLPDSEWKLIREDGNVILEGRSEIESPTGVLDWDGEYGTDIVRNLSECSDDECQLIIDEYDNGHYVDSDVIDYACQALNLLRVKKVGRYDNGLVLDGDVLFVHTQYYDRVIVRNSFDDEYDVREIAKDMGFIPESIDKIVKGMREVGWL